MNRSALINNFIGWLIFFISAAVYILTLEPTAGWWDCSEFIISAYKLEVGHPPGAPLYMLLGRFFSLFAGDLSKVAFMVNLLSALASAGAVMFLYRSVVLLARKLFSETSYSTADQIVIFGSGVVGSLAFAFTGSFWFSAVESEVYALSLLFTSVVFWAILKWEDQAELPGADKWIIFIAYIIGLSIGVHLLSLLVIPAIVLVYYFKNYGYSLKGVVVASIFSILILGFIQSVLIPGVPRLAFLSDILFVNFLGLPFNSGVIFFIVLLTVTLIWAISFTFRKGYRICNLTITALTVILIGYSSYAVIMIRSDANPPMNQTQPDNAFSLLRYLNRDQYGSSNILYGPWYNAPVIGTGGIKKYYDRIGDRYEIIGTTAQYNRYPSKMKTLFPRMYSSDPRHINTYQNWGRIKGREVSINVNGKEEILVKPTFMENMRFFMRYQLGYMYFRYFMWNFAGRQNDVQGDGSFMNGNWISGIELFDAPRVGTVNDQPDFMKSDHSRTKYFFLPLLFGLIGLFYQYNCGRKGREGFMTLLALFLFTGIAIVVYLNQTPLQPRERDYAYVGSFFAFSAWIGLALPAFWSGIRKLCNCSFVAVITTIIAVFAVPGVLLAENYGAYNRTGRYMTRDYAVNYLESCAPNAILFTFGDNDTFPLWYVQEVEGIRPDIKILNFNYLGTDWYINQNRKTTNEAAPIPFSFQQHQYYSGSREIVLVEDAIQRAIDLRDAISFVGSDDEDSKVRTVNDDWLDYFPSKQFYLPVDKERILETATVELKDFDNIADTIFFQIDKRYLIKPEWVLLNIIAANDWERPIYFNHSLLFANSFPFSEWLQFEGFTYRLVPLKRSNETRYTGFINTDILYRNVMERYSWGNIDHPDVTLDDYNKRAVRIIQARTMFTRLAEALIDEGRSDRAIEVLDKMFAIFPDEKMPLSFDSFPAIEQYMRAGAKEKGLHIANILTENSFALLEYYLMLPERLSRYTDEEQEIEMMNLQDLMVLAESYELTLLYNDIDKRLQQLITALSNQ